MKPLITSDVGSDRTGDHGKETPGGGLQAIGSDGAGEGNRTLVIWLGTKSSTIKLHPLGCSG